MSESNRNIYDIVHILYIFSLINFARKLLTEREKKFKNT